MKIEDLDEYQGLTQAMVRTHAEAHGFTYHENTLYCPQGKAALFFATNPHFIGHVVSVVAKHLSLSDQAILRDINPRMRKQPSTAAIGLHNGHWIVQDTETGSLGIWQPHMMSASHDARLSFWPCDANGNKVRWPEVDGQML